MSVTLVAAMGGHLVVVLLLTTEGRWLDPARDRSTSSSQLTTRRLSSRYAHPGTGAEFQSVGHEIQMSVFALFTWMVTILAGLVILIIWIIEYDSEFQTAAATRLPVPVISAHALLGLGGLMLWISYTLEDQQQMRLAAV